MKTLLCLPIFITLVAQAVELNQHTIDAAAIKIIGRAYVASNVPKTENTDAQLALTAKETAQRIHICIYERDSNPEFSDAECDKAINALQIYAEAGGFADSDNKSEEAALTGLIIDRIKASRTPTSKLVYAAEAGVGLMALYGFYKLIL